MLRLVAARTPSDPVRMLHQRRERRREMTIDQFIAQHIRSVEQLEILLLLQRSPDTYWTAAALAQHLGIAASLADNQVKALVRDGLAHEGASGPQYRYDAGNAERAQMVVQLAAAYRERRISVINAIYEANLTRLRTFADAFKFGGKKESDS
jgi:predicted ArsR family transcriptional regulator